MLCTKVLIISSSDNGILMTYENNYSGLKLKRRYFMSHLKEIINYTRGLLGVVGMRVSYHPFFGLLIIHQNEKL